MEQSPMDRSPETNAYSPLRILLVVCLILAVGLGTAVYLIKTKPTAQKVPPTRQVPLVECLTVEKGPHSVAISGMGTVIPSARIDLKSKVSGEVIRVSESFIPGGHFKKDDIILEIDPQDYDLAITKKESLLNHAKASLDLELGRQAVAREELVLMQKNAGRTFDDSNLALRKPQLDQARADYDSALADLEMARLDRDRTVIRAPFNGLVLSRNTHRGAQVSSLETLATIANTDVYWVEASVPANRLSRITLPGKKQRQGSSAVITNDAGTAQFSGQVITLSGQLTEQSRLASVMIRVDDPLNLRSGATSPPLLLDDYVHARIDGGIIHDVIALPRSALRDGNRVWVLENGHLFIRKVTTVWSDETHVYINEGLDPDDRVIVSNLSGVIDKMSVRSNSGPESKQNGDS